MYFKYINNNINNNSDHNNNNNNNNNNNSDHNNNNNNNINNSDSDNNYKDKEGGKMAGYIANVPEVRWLYVHLSGVGWLEEKMALKQLHRLLLHERAICKLPFLSN